MDCYGCSLIKQVSKSLYILQGITGQKTKVIMYTGEKFVLTNI